MALVKLRVAGRELAFDDDESKLTFGDAYALREVSAATGVDAPQLMADVHSGDRDAQGQAILVLAYLAAVRADHDLRWRDFLFTVPMNGVEVLGDEAPVQVAPAVAEQAAAAVAGPSEDALAERVLDLLAKRNATPAA